MKDLVQRKFAVWADLPPPLFIVVFSSVTAFILANGTSWLLVVGLCFAIYILIVAIFSQWLGMLALFPLVFSLPPTPSSVGVREAIYAALVLIVGFGVLFNEFRSFGTKCFFKKHSKGILVFLVFLVVNGVVAFSRNVGFSDWLRGLVPFLFVLMYVPVSILLERNPGEQKFFLYSLLSFVFLMVGNVVFYYFNYSLWQPYWHIVIEGTVVKTTDVALVQKYPADAVGPLIDRITLQLQSATDAVLPVGLVTGFVLSVLFGRSRFSVWGNVLAFLSLAAILITFTRSMLTSAVFVIAIFSLFILFCRREKLKTLLLNLILLASFGVSFLFATGMEHIWVGRMDWLVESVRQLPDLPNNLDSKSNEPAASSGQPTGPDQLVPPSSPNQIDHNVLSESIKPESDSDIAVEAPKKKLDFNVGSRLEEYLVAWDIFKSNPLLGGGLGVRHDMRWETAEGESLYQSVSYVHNWIFYTLMVGGILGLIVYGFMLLGPILIQLDSLLTDDVMLVIRTGLLTMAIYGLFFAVFRLITFNMLLAAVWGYLSFKRLSFQIRK